MSTPTSTIPNVPLVIQSVTIGSPSKGVAPKEFHPMLSGAKNLRWVAIQDLKAGLFLWGTRHTSDTNKKITFDSKKVPVLLLADTSHEDNSRAFKCTGLTATGAQIDLWFGAEMDQQGLVSDGT